MSSNKVIVRAVEPSAGVRSIEGYVNPETNRWTSFFRYETEANGDFKLDANGLPIVKTYYDSVAKSSIPETYELRIRPGVNQLELDKKLDKTIIKQLEECPLNLNVTDFRGINVSGVGKYFVIIDPEKEKEQLIAIKKQKAESWELSRGVTSNKMIAYHLTALCYVYGHGELNPKDKEDYELSIAFESFADREPDKFIRYMRNNAMDDSMLLAMAMQKNKVRYVQNRGYLYSQDNGQEMAIGSTIDSVISYFNETPLIKNELIASTEYQTYLSEKVKKEKKPSDKQYQEVVSEKDKQIETLAAQLAIYQKQSASLTPEGKPKL